jgi:phosphatidylinositol kinase/protein kinase (PI-3  family)
MKKSSHPLQPESSEDHPNQSSGLESDQSLQFLFKCGDDLRQDNLVLQFFKLMDRLWNENSLELNMICYDIMETGYQIGYIQFV